MDMIPGYQETGGAAVAAVPTQNTSGKPLKKRRKLDAATQAKKQKSSQYRDFLLQCARQFVRRDNAVGIALLPQQRLMVSAPPPPPPPAALQQFRSYPAATAAVGQSVTRRLLTSRRTTTAQPQQKALSVETEIDMPTQRITQTISAPPPPPSQLPSVPTATLLQPPSFSRLSQPSKLPSPLLTPQPSPPLQTPPPSPPVATTMQVAVTQPQLPLSQELLTQEERDDDSDWLYSYINDKL